MFLWANHNLIFPVTPVHDYYLVSCITLLNIRGYYMATIVRALWLVAKWALFLCNDRALFTSCSRYIQRTFDSEDPCYGQLTAVKKGIPWPVSHDYITDSSVQLAEVIFFFLSYPLTNYWFYWSQSQLLLVFNINNTKKAIW